MIAERVYLSLEEASIKEDWDASTRLWELSCAEPNCAFQLSMNEQIFSLSPSEQEALTLLLHNEGADVDMTEGGVNRI